MWILFGLGGPADSWFLWVGVVKRGCAIALRPSQPVAQQQPGPGLYGGPPPPGAYYQQWNQPQSQPPMHHNVSVPGCLAHKSCHVYVRECAHERL